VYDTWYVWRIWNTLGCRLACISLCNQKVFFPRGSAHSPRCTGTPIHLAAGGSVYVQGILVIFRNTWSSCRSIYTRNHSAKLAKVLANFRHCALESSVDVETKFWTSICCTNHRCYSLFSIGAHSCSCKRPCDFPQMPTPSFATFISTTFFNDLLKVRPHNFPSRVFNTVIQSSSKLDS